MGVVSNEIMNEQKAATDAISPVAPNVLNAALPYGGGLSMVVVENVKVNKL